MSASLRQRVLDHVRGRRLFPEPGIALLAVSGGPDSVAMLDLLAGMSSELGLELVVGHVDHGILADSQAVAQLVKDVAGRYRVPCRVAALQLGAQASETEAREARYRELRRMQREAGARYLVTGHHLDDQAETVLYRMLRGSGVMGLAGIPERGPNGLVRPLLPFRRSELQRCVSVETHRDPANEDTRHDRSWLRSRLMPLVVERFGDDAAVRLNDVARSAEREREAWAALLRAIPDLAFRVDGHGVALARAPLQRYDNMLSEALLRALAREAGCVPGAERIAHLLEFVRSGHSGRVFELGQGWEAELSFDRLRIAQVHELDALPAVPAGEGAEGTAHWGRWVFTWRSEPAGLAVRRGYETWVTPGPMRIRGVAPGDRIRPLGGIGGRKVRRLLMEQRVPFRERAAYPVVERGTHVLWVPGVCRSSSNVPRRGDVALRVEARRPHNEREEPGRGSGRVQ